MKYLSLGLEYLRLQDSDFSESASGAFLGVTLSGTLDIEPTIDAVMINVAIRNNSGNIHPYFLRDMYGKQPFSVYLRFEADSGRFSDLRDCGRTGCTEKI